ncbi:MAG TPA: flavin reductase family protein [Streptosporangiaceae bacterium]
MTRPDRTAVAGGPALRRLMRRWPAGVAVVTTAHGEDGRETDPAGCTVSAFLSVSLRPPLVLVSLSEHSRTLRAVVERGVFCVNILAEEQRDLAGTFAGPAGDRFRGVDYHWRSGVPVLGGTVAATVCSVERVIPAADHSLVLGSPLWCRQDESADPVVLLDGAYYTLPARPAHG